MKDDIQVTIGNIPLDLSIYQDIEEYKNVTVIVSENVKTGEISLSWRRQPNTVKIY